MQAVVCCCVLLFVAHGIVLAMPCIMHLILRCVIFCCEKRFLQFVFGVPYRVDNFGWIQRCEFSFDQ